MQMCGRRAMSSGCSCFNVHYSRGFLNKLQIPRGFGLFLLSDISPSGWRCETTRPSRGKWLCTFFFLWLFWLDLLCIAALEHFKRIVQGLFMRCSANFVMRKCRLEMVEEEENVG